MGRFVENESHSGFGRRGMRVAIAFGTRPEVIKIAPVYFELRNRRINTLMVATAQHREMMDMMLEVFKIKPDIDMNIMVHNQTLNYVASEVFKKMDKVLKDEKIDVLLVQGDTTTAMASAMAAFHNDIKVGHIEAGLRSKNIRDPFPEEMNRRVIDVFADYAFAPTRKAKDNLEREGVERERIFVTGNTVVDALQMISKKLPEVEKGDYILVTMHRRENIGEKMESVLKALKKFSKESGIKIIFPVHKNPRVREIVFKILGDCKNAKLTDPVNYMEFLKLLKSCRFVVTDSGGVQEEAPSFGKFAVGVRNTTERPELVESGWGVLAGTSTEGVRKALEKALNFSKSGKENPFGDGRASERIVDILVKGKTEEFKG